MREHSKKTLALLTLKGYDEKFFELLPFCETHKKAWEKLEDIYYQSFGKNRYTSYESFKAARSKRIRRNRKNA